MALDWALLGFTVLGVAVNSAAGWFQKVKLDKEQDTDWKKLGVSLLQAVGIGLLVGLTSATPLLAGTVGLLGAKTLDKVGLQYK